MREDVPEDLRRHVDQYQPVQLPLAHGCIKPQRIGDCIVRVVDRGRDGKRFGDFIKSDDELRAA
ncbi:MAG: hypothetical protein ACXV9P_08690, partial [Acidimicrobiia bacterium]